MADGRSAMVPMPSAMSHQPLTESLAAAAAAGAATTLSTATTAAASRAAAARRQIRRHARSRFETQLPFGDHGLARLQPLLHDDVVGDALSRRDRALLDGRIGLHHEDVLAILSGLHGL